MCRGKAGNLKEAAAAFYEKQVTEEEAQSAGFDLEDYDQDDFEIWPENWPAFSLFCKVETQWRVGMSGSTGLDYTPLLALMARMKLSDEDHDDLFADLQVLERAALDAMNQKD